MAFLDRLVIATDSLDVQDACLDAGAEVVLTSASHPSGSDRAWEAAESLGEDFDVIVNVQGDEPLVASGSVKGAIDMVERGFDIGTCATPARATEDLGDPGVVKVVRALNGTALYFSRAVIPHGRADPGGADGLLKGGYLIHVGLYAYRRRALERWAGLGPSRLEQMEGLEQLRALENGMRIGVALVAEAGGGVNTPEDLSKMEARLRSLGYHERGLDGGAGTGIGQSQGNANPTACDGRLA